MGQEGVRHAAKVPSWIQSDVLKPDPHIATKIAAVLKSQPYRTLKFPVTHAHFKGDLDLSEDRR